jgi:hypothetical protein
VVLVLAFLVVVSTEESLEVVLQLLIPHRIDTSQHSGIVDSGFTTMAH